MSRQVSATMLQAMLAQSTTEIPLTVIKITHASLASPMLFVNDKISLDRSDGTYLPAAFEFRLPDDQQDNIPRGQIVLDNVDRQIIQAVRPLQSAPEIEVNIVLASQPNTVEVGPMRFKLKQFEYDATTMKGTVAYDEDFLNQNIPKDMFSPRTTPGIF